MFTMTNWLVIWYRDERRSGVTCFQVFAGRKGLANGLFYIGPILKDRYWEAVAVPELRTHPPLFGKDSGGRD